MHDFEKDDRNDDEAQDEGGGKRMYVPQIGFDEFGGLLTLISHADKPVLANPYHVPGELGKGATRASCAPCDELLAEV